MEKNTNITSSRTSRFMFTRQLGLEYKEQEFIKIFDKLEDKCKLYSSLYQFQLEKGEDTNRYHIQGFIMLDDKMSGQALVNRLDKKIGWCQKMISANGWDYTEKHNTSIKPEIFRRTRGTKLQMEKYFKDPNLKNDKGISKREIVVTAINSGASLQDIENIDSAFYVFNEQYIQKARLNYLQKKQIENFPSNYDPFRLVFYVYGESGSGKNKMIDFLALRLKYKIAYVTNYKFHPFDELQEQEILLLSEYKSQFNKEFFQDLIDKRTNFRLPARYGNKLVFYNYIFMTSVLPFNMLHNNDYNQIDNRKQLERRVDYVINLTEENSQDIENELFSIIQKNEELKEQFLKLSYEDKINYLRTLQNGRKQPIKLGFYPILQQIKMKDKEMPF